MFSFTIIIISIVFFFGEVASGQWPSKGILRLYSVFDSRIFARFRGHPESLTPVVQKHAKSELLLYVFVLFVFGMAVIVRHAIIIIISWPGNFAREKKKSCCCERTRTCPTKTTTDGRGLSQATVSRRPRKKSASDWHWTLCIGLI